MKVRVIGEVGQVKYELKHISQVAKMLGYSLVYTRRLCDEGQLIAFKVGRDWWAYPELIKREALPLLQE